MCNLTEAKRHEKLAVLLLEEGNKAKAIDHYLEAAGIYLLNIELLKKEELLDEANRCYHQVQHLRGDTEIKMLSKQELAKRTLETDANHHHHDDLEEIEDLLSAKMHSDEIGSIGDKDVR